MSAAFKVGDLVQLIGADYFLSSFKKKTENRDAVVEWLGPDSHGQFKNRMRVRFLKRNGRGKEFTEIMDVRDFKAKQPQKVAA